MGLKTWMAGACLGLSALVLTGCVSESETYDSGYRRPAVYATGVYYERDVYRPGYDRDRWDRRDRDRPERYAARPDDGRPSARPYRGDRDPRVSARCMNDPRCVAGDRVDQVDEYRGRNRVELR